jgi:phosphoribosylformimino-5-aminoimidazole carboxamide ribonucleotide (ProFAR) isomerase
MFQFASKILYLIVTTAIDTDGKISGISPQSMIPLDQPQEIPTETTFDMLEVANKLEVNGTISGRKLDDFLPNPSLAESNSTTKNC